MYREGARHSGVLVALCDDFAKFDTLETKFDTLETKFDTLNSTVSAQIGDLKTYFTTAFSDSHFFNRNRVEMM